MTIASWISQSPSLNWLTPARQELLAQTIKTEKTYTLFENFMANKADGNFFKTSDLLDTATLIAEHADTRIEKNRTVLFSGSVQEQAENFISNNDNHHVIHSCPAGAMLEMLDLFNPKTGLNRQDSYQPGNILAARLAEYARGDITAFIKDPHPNSTFRTVELNIIMQNKNVSTINKRDKYLFEHLITGSEQSSLQFKSICSRIIVGYKNSVQIPNLQLQ